MKKQLLTLLTGVLVAACIFTACSTQQGTVNNSTTENEARIIGDITDMKDIVWQEEEEPTETTTEDMSKDTTEESKNK